jgi:F-type H+-transporting ATPase subunit b
MLTLILAAAPAASLDGSPDLLTRFGIEWNYVIFQLISFSILAFVLYKFAIKPILATVDERTTQIDSGLKNAAATGAQLEQAKVDAAVVLKQAQVEAGKIIETARQTAKASAERETTAATVRANELITKAQHAIELEHRKMIAEARTEIARLVVITTQQVLAKELTADDRARYNAAAAKELSVA